MPITHKIAADGGGESRRLAAEKTPCPRRGNCRRRRREGRCSPAGTKGDRTPYGFLSPLDSLTFLCAATPFGRAAKRELRGLGSVRRADFGTLLCPECTLRDLPRITVRGQPVQGGGVLLRKAPLPSSVLPWSTKRHCGPLAFRRATEGSRVLKEGLGESRGGKGTIRCPCPLLSPPGDPGNPPAAGRRQSLSAVGYGLRRLQRRAAVSAERLTLC